MNVVGLVVLAVVLLGILFIVVYFTKKETCPCHQDSKDPDNHHKGSDPSNSYNNPNPSVTAKNAPHTIEVVSVPIKKSGKSL